MRGVIAGLTLSAAMLSASIVEGGPWLLVTVVVVWLAVLAATKWKGEA